MSANPKDKPAIQLFAVSYLSGICLISYFQEETGRGKLHTNEKELWDICSGPCDADGIQRTDLRGCSQVKNCVLEQSGPLCEGIYRNDFGVCDCIHLDYSDNNAVKNVEYNPVDAHLI